MGMPGTSPKLHVFVFGDFFTGLRPGYLYTNPLTTFSSRSKFRGLVM